MRRDFQTLSHGDFLGGLVGAEEYLSIIPNQLQSLPKVTTSGIRPPSTRNRVAGAMPIAAAVSRIFAAPRRSRTSMPRLSSGFFANRSPPCHIVKHNSLDETTGFCQTGIGETEVQCRNESLGEICSAPPGTEEMSMEKQLEQTDLHGPDQPDPETRSYEIDVANEQFESRTMRIKPYEATGQGLIEALGYKPIDAYVVLRYRTDGSLEEIGLEESFDIAEPRRNSFFVNETAEMANLVIGGVRLTWTQEVITGRTVKQLARQPDTDLVVVMERGEEPPQIIRDDEEVRIGRPGLERFHLRPPVDVEIKVNNNAVKIRHGWRTGLEIKTAAIDQGVKIQLSFTLSEDLPDGTSKLVGDSDRVWIKGGEQFLAIDDHDDSGW